MPTTSQEDFAAFKEALEKNNIEDLKKIISTFDVTATDDDGWNCLMLACCESSSTEVLNLLLEKIDEAGGSELLKEQVTQTDDCERNCLMFTCEFSESADVIKILFEKIVGAGGPDLLKGLLTSADAEGFTCLDAACGNSESLEVAEFLAAVLFHFDLFQQQFVKLARDDQNRLKEEAGIDSSWTPDAATVAEVKEILQSSGFASKNRNDNDDDEAVGKNKETVEASEE